MYALDPQLVIDLHAPLKFFRGARNIAGRVAAGVGGAVRGAAGVARRAAGAIGRLIRPAAART